MVVIEREINYKKLKRGQKGSSLQRNFTQWSLQRGSLQREWTVCKELAAAKKKKKDKDNNVSLEENLTCCVRHILASQVDFKNQKPLLQERIEAKGHKVVFYPKFHCELNYIEMYWGAAKRYVRQHCDYTWKDL